jgi:hypothetical protein
MKLAWIGSAVLALGVSAAVPTFARADYRHEDRDHDRYERRDYDRHDDHFRDDDRFRHDDRYRDFDHDVSLRDVPRNVMETFNCEIHGRIERVQYVHRDGKFFYRFEVDGDRRYEGDSSVRIGANGRLLSVEEAAQCDAGWHRR